MNAPSVTFDPSQFKTIGKPLLRKEDDRLVQGKGRFSDDFNLDGQAYAVVLRSPHPSAKIVRLDAQAAKARPGVLGIFSGGDLLADQLKPIPHAPAAQSKYDLKLTSPQGGAPFIGPHHILAIDVVRYVGEAIAIVVADTVAAALDAAEAIEIEYGELPFVSTAEDALAEGAPLVWAEAGSNVMIDTSFGDRAATDEAFAKADHVVSAKFTVGRVTAVAMEPRAALGSYDPDSDRYTLYAGSGGAVKQKKEFAGVLNIEPKQLRVGSFDVGGNFGSRNRPYVEFALVLWAARKVGRPVKYTASRSESFFDRLPGTRSRQQPRAGHSKGRPVSRDARR